MMELRTETIKFSNGLELTISEANFDMSAVYKELEQEAVTHPSEDPLEAILATIYPSLFACSIGEVPDKQQAMRMALEAPNDFDAWFCAVRRKNPHWFSVSEKKEPESVLVTLRDGSKITVFSSYDHPSFVFKAQVIRNELAKLPADNMRKQAFQLRFYPFMAACSTGDVPGCDEALNWPEVELDKWGNTCMRLNSSLFPTLTDQELEQVDKKKSKRTRSKS